jgi:hypothetical protein
MHHLQAWAVNDFDLFEFIGQDESDHHSDSQQSGLYPSGSADQFEPNEKQQNDDYMYSVMQYNDMAYENQHHQNMYNPEMNGFMQEDRYSQNPAASGLLNSTINKLHQQQNQNQPSTSRLSNVVNANQTYASRMRPQLPQQLGQPQMNGDLAENVLLPTSSQSPQNHNGSMYLPQTMIKAEPQQYGDMVGHDDQYFDSTSDNDSHYSGHNRSLMTPSAKPRKYRIKPECERVTPQYRMKRAKNNDAVRRSREKAKNQLQEKEKRLHFLESEHNDHYKQLNSLKQRVRDLEAENMALRKSCNCGSAQQLSQFRR